MGKVDDSLMTRERIARFLLGPCLWANPDSHALILQGDGPATLEGGLVSLRVGTQARSNAIEPAELWDELTKDLHHHGISVVKSRPAQSPAPATQG